MQDFHLLSRLQKGKGGKFLLGTTNRLLKEANHYGIELLVNLENCTLEKKKIWMGWEGKTEREKRFVQDIEGGSSTEQS